MGEHRTKNPDYSDVLYVSQLVGPDAVNTMPKQTLRAFADHGEVTATLAADPAGADRIPADTRAASIDLPNVNDELEREAIESFCESYHQLLDCVQSKLGALATRAS